MSETTADELRDYLQVCLLPGIGPKHLEILLSRFGTCRGILEASKTDLERVVGVGPVLSNKIRNAKEHVDPDQVIEQCRQGGIEIISQGHARYPRPLQRIFDAPPILFARGTLVPADELAVAIVGTRHATHYGRTQAQKVACGLARRGVTVISGLARGVDAEAHRGALEGGGRTIAVLGSGHEELYPAEHKDLAAQIAASGCVITEFPPWTKPRGPHFPQRNRLISGLSLGVLVIEAADRSGALVTARHAIEQSREVFALPGPVASRVSRGCHALIRDGAALIENAEQIIDHLGPLANSIPIVGETEVRSPLELNLNDQEVVVLDAIGTEPTAIDAVVQRTDLPVPRVLSTISVLEMKRLIRRVSGQFVCRI
jgi:DNA processing protein